jgi:hypothetical protein
MACQDARAAGPSAEAIVRIDRQAPTTPAMTRGDHLIQTPAQLSTDHLHLPIQSLLQPARLAHNRVRQRRRLS